MVFLKILNITNDKNFFYWLSERKINLSVKKKLFVKSIIFIKKKNWNLMKEINLYKINKYL